MNNRAACRPVASPFRGLGLTFNFCSLVLALSTTLPAGAQEPPPLPSDNGSILQPRRGSVIVKEIDVRFGTTGVVDRARVISLMRLKVGEPWTQEKEEDDLRALYNSGNFTNSSITTVDVPGGLKVIVTVDARPAMGELVFQGNTVFTSDRLKDEVEFKSGGVVDDTKLSEAKAKILEMYKKKGYPDAVVTYELQPGATSGFSRIVIRIDEGGRGVINSVLFEGNTVFSSGRLRGEITSDNRNWLKIWDLKRKLDHEKLEKDIVALHDFYGNHGYFDARATAQAVPAPGNSGKINLVFTIVEGPQYTTAGVNVAGNKIYTTEQLLPVFQLEAGKTFSLEGMRADLETISEYYGARGYAEVRVTPRIDKRADNQLFVTYAIEEGGQFKVGKINIIGNNDTRDMVIRRELVIAPGDDYNTIKIRKSIQKVKNLDYFEENNGVDFMPVSSELGPEYKDINLTVNEKKTGQLQFGAGFSSIDSLVGMVELTQRNFDLTNWPTFTGGGQRFRLSLRAGSKRKDFLLSITEPYFMQKRLSVGGDIFWTEKTYLSDVYDQRDAGFTLNVRTPLTDNSDLRLNYTIQEVEIYNIDQADPETSDAIKAEEGKFLQSRLGASWVFDNRNSFQQPSKGHKISLDTTFSGEFLGGEVNTYSVSITGQKYWKLPFKSVFALEGRLAVVDSTDGGTVPIFERLTLGGANNLRGFKYREVGFQVPGTDDGTLDRFGEPLGGNSAGYLTAEYTFPVIRKIRGALFADAGFVNKDSWDFSLSDYNADVGIGVRFTLPVLGPIKLDYGWPVVADDANDGSGRFNFSVDYKF
ncbi:MAG TPA: outer membrane protein assembly factor BamA [Verrucomicrobiales bacterium]|nr:outer membrane protein assembly factor BamA [Verrucomicrobiales bacterium]